MNDKKLAATDYTLRGILAILAITIIVLFVTSVISGVIAIVFLALAIGLIIMSIVGFKRIKRKFQ